MRNGQRQTLELATFTVGKEQCGIDILQIQEINKIIQRTPIPQAPDYVVGVFNLRGRIVTIVDLCKKLGLGKTEMGERTRNIVVNSFDGSAGLLVSSIGDMVVVEANSMEQAPANLCSIEHIYFTGVFKTETQIIGLLDIDKVMSLDDCAMTQSTTEQGSTSHGKN
ncbi:chemotaxis protein CheW [Desulfobulbus marinus]|nr:chemotaxis protein CheW [Desulfogranum marinum]